ncbi:class I SAM-dependent methyltransferase [Zobellella denitrificans]
MINNTMSYQSYLNTKDNSYLLNILSSLRVPSLSEKRFLHIGCNEGFLCGYALFEGAIQVVGIDESVDAIANARHYFPMAEFIALPWGSLPEQEGEFDVITLLSSLHHVIEQSDFLHHLVELLSDDGVLILELGIATSTKAEWVTDDHGHKYPTRPKLKEILKNYAWKEVNHSINPKQTNITNYIVHVRKLKPYAWLFMQPPGSGKSTISRCMFSGKSGVPIISGDRTYLQVTQGKFDVSAELRSVISADFSTATIDKTTQRVLEQGLSLELVKLWTQLAGYRNFALDSYVPEPYHQKIREHLKGLGYFPVDICWNNPTPLPKAQDAISRANDYEAHLKKLAEHPESASISIKKLLKSSFSKNFRWHLDSPEQGQFVNHYKIKISGWLVETGEYSSLPNVYIDGSQGVKLFKLDRTRHDVLEALFVEDSKIPDYLRNRSCGFSFMLDTSWFNAGFELGIDFGNTKIPLAYITVQPNNGKLGRRLLRSIRRYTSQ